MQHERGAGRVGAGSREVERVGYLVVSTDKGLVLVQKNLFVLSDIVSQTHFVEGIAYDDENDRLFVTGKLWPKLYELVLEGGI